MRLSRRRILISAACGALGRKLLPSDGQSGNQPLASSSYPAPKGVVNLPRSRVLRGFEWPGPSIPHPEIEKRGDTFPITWAQDDRLYTSAGDPAWSDKQSGLDVECIEGLPPVFHVSRPNAMDGFVGYGGAGPKPAGLISVKGTLYLAFQNATGPGESTSLNPF